MGGVGWAFAVALHDGTTNRIRQQSSDRQATIPHLLRNALLCLLTHPEGWVDISRSGSYTFSRKAKHTAGPVAQPKANRDLCAFFQKREGRTWSHLSFLTVYLVGICVVFLLQVLVYVRNGEKTDRVRTLWLTPIVVLPIALYFYLFAGIAVAGWVLFAGGVSLVVGAVLEWVHIRSAQIRN